MNKYQGYEGSVGMGIQAWNKDGSPKIIQGLEDVDDEESPLLEKDEALYNIYGQRKHPYASPHQYQHVGAQLYAGISSTQGHHGAQYMAPVAYEQKYGLKPKETPGEIKEDLENSPNKNQVLLETSSYFMQQQTEFGGKKDSSNASTYF
jgi:hypothetical protein